MGSVSMNKHWLLRRLAFLALIFVCDVTMMGSDSCKITVNVKTPPVTFATDNTGAKLAPLIDVAPGQTFTLGIPYQNGKGPYTCTLANAPAWMSVTNDAPSSSCVVTGTVPACAAGSGLCDGPVTGNLTVTDANGTTAVASLGSTATGGK